MNVSSTINNVVRSLISYYIDNQVPFRVTILDKDDIIDLPAHLFSQNGTVISIDAIGWNLETASYDDKYLHITYVLSSEEVPLALPFVTLISIMDMINGALVLSNPYPCDIKDVTIDNMNEVLEAYIESNKEGVEHSISCLKLEEIK